MWPWDFVDVPNSLGNNNLKTCNPHLLKKMDFWLFKEKLFTSSIGFKNFFFNFKGHDLTKGIEGMSKIW
jgi:hypothetical protein